MAFIGTDSFYHYQPLIAGLHRDGRSRASNLHLPTAHARGNNLTSYGESKKSSRRLADCNLIEVVDITGPLPEEPLNPFYVPVPDLDCTERDAKDTSNGLNATRGYSRSGGEKDGDFLPVDKLLLGAGETQERQRTGSSGSQATGGSEGNSEPTAERDRNSAASPRSSEGEGEHQEESVLVGDTLTEDRNTQNAQRVAGGGDEERKAVRLGDQSIVAHNTENEDDSDAYEAVRNQPTPIFKDPSILRPQDGKNRASLTWNKPGSPGDPIVVDDNNTDSGGDGTSKEQVGNYVSLGTSPTSGGASEARYLNLHENSQQNIHNTSPLYRNTLSSTPGKQTCGSNSGNCKGLRPALSTGRDKKNLWNGQETDADKKKEDQERHNKGSDREIIPSPGPMEKKRPSAVEGKRRVKRRRCLSPKRGKAGSSQDNILAVQDQDLDTQPDGISPESKGVQPKLYNTTIPRGPASGTATSLPTLKQAQGHGDKPQAKEPEWEIRTILRKRETVSGTEYQVRWENTWLPKGELGNARELLREFEAKRQAQHGRQCGRPACTDKVW